VLYEYPVFKIYEGDEEALQKSDNPFDLAHYAGIQAWKHRRQDARKLIYMKTMLHILNERGWSRDEKLWLLWFIEGVTHIRDAEVWQEWEQELERKGKEEGGMYISLMERKGIEKGLRKGMQKGMQKGRKEERTIMAVSMLREGIPLPTIAKITGFSEEEIQEFARQQAQ
jgi:predicted transposase/invertase (TIGR01784 family)